MVKFLYWAAGIAALAGIAYLVHSAMKSKDDNKAIPPTAVKADMNAAGLSNWSE